MRVVCVTECEWEYSVCLSEIGSGLGGVLKWDLREETGDEGSSLRMVLSGSNLRMVLSGSSLRMSQVFKLFENWFSLGVF